MKYNTLIFGLLFLLACASLMPIEKHARHYQKHQDYASLSKVVDLVQIGQDTSEIKKLLGEPINMGFDFRYLIDSTSAKGCAIGAVFHIDEEGKIDQKWIDEICE